MTEQAKCMHCSEAIEKGVGGLWYSARSGSACYENRGQGGHTPADPSPAPQANLLADICPSCGSTDKAERAVCANAWHGTPQAPSMPTTPGEIPRYDIYWNMDRQPKMILANHGQYVRYVDHLAALTAAREERDRAQEAIVEVLSHLDSCIECGPVDAYKNRLRTALKPVSYRQPEGETK